MNERTAILVERVLVALRPMDRPDQMVDVATRLAAAFGARLSGHFVKDRDLIDFAALSFTRRIDMRTGALETLEAGMMERALNAYADAARRALEARAAARLLQWSFETITARSLEAMSDLCRQPGLVIATLDGDGHAAPERHLAELIGLLPGTSPVLLLRSGQPFAGPVVTTADERALAYADQVAAEFGETLIVLVGTEAERKKAMQLAGRVRSPMRIEQAGAAGAGPREAYEGGLLVIGRHDIADYADFAKRTDCHIFVADEA